MASEASIPFFTGTNEMSPPRRNRDIASDDTIVLPRIGSISGLSRLTAMGLLSSIVFFTLTGIGWAAVVFGKPYAESKINQENALTAAILQSIEESKHRAKEADDRNDKLAQALIMHYQTMELIRSDLQEIKKELQRQGADR